MELPVIISTTPTISINISIIKILIYKLNLVKQDETKILLNYYVPNYVPFQKVIFHATI